LGSGVFVADNARLIGDIEIGSDSSVWFGCVLRGDVNRIRIGARTNIQDLSVIHVNEGTHPTIVGDGVTVGHRVILHGCRVENGSLVGMGSVLLDGVVVEERAFVAAGSIVSPGTVVPAGHLVRGVPARVARELTAEELASLETSAESYCALKADYLNQAGAE
jgi:carbonic anhydrase/acetyltransferase-like protein (isoleucine patch superfamily)